MTAMKGGVVVVTGAGQGIGLGIAGKLAAAGATVVIADLDGDRAQSAAGETPGDVFGLTMDVTSRDSVEKAVAAVVRDHGAIDVLVNNAGWDQAGAFAESDPDLWSRILQINLHGVLHTCRAVLPHMIERGSGRIVNVASEAGRVGGSGQAVYSASKGGVIAFTKAIALENARHGIVANCVSPGPTDTALFASMGGDNPRFTQALSKAIPMGRIGAPDDVANAVLFFASGQASYVTGQTLSVSGGLVMV